MNNIFENAKFGDCFKTRDGRKALYLASTMDNLHFCIVDDFSLVIRNYLDSGEETMFERMPMDSPYNIIEDWHKEINEKKLEELAWDNAGSLEIGRPITINHVVRAYKAGFRAKEAMG